VKRESKFGSKVSVTLKVESKVEKKRETRAASASFSMEPDRYTRDLFLLKGDFGLGKKQKQVERFQLQTNAEGG